ncbi:TetR/AcrR family transcriptional regulator [Pigmentiphaga aceris]|uniref:TetR/AcrR family transcriptional regulator n=1 Tax=Pigmentiphaga aceris TaxID=1940612 RepID=A0A5C0AZF2_9BURK|nr:TetR/AcrR family transcriptional regulator [Pigmentiphaga aceris]QEI07842.1 TetR/AcrR family transcriptional regulator [Pigmentiphaga aceris]
MSTLPHDQSAGQRGPADHTIREQIVSAANEHFAKYGYGKTTVSDLAKEIGFSKAYIYKFFDSKQAIGEAICNQCLDAVLASVALSMADAKTPTDKLRRMFRAIVTASAELFFSDRKLYDIASHSVIEKWSSSTQYGDKIYAMLEQIIVEGRQSGEFERKTPLDETCRAITQAMQPFTNPVMLQHSLDLLPDGPNEVISLVLRSLSP